MNKDLNYYLNLPWTYCFEWSTEDNCYIASIAELKGCITDGQTIQESTEMIQDALKSYISAMLESNTEILEPPKPDQYKGNITYRTTPQKHYKLAKKAAALGKSINKFIDEVLDKEIA